MSASCAHMLPSRHVPFSKATVAKAASCDKPLDPRYQLDVSAIVLSSIFTICYGCCAGRIEISAQNHNYAVNPATLPEDVEVTHINLNDGTCAGLLCKPKKAMSIQYHPEASPGPHDADVCFEQFIDMLKAERAGAVQAAVAA